MLFDPEGHFTFGWGATKINRSKAEINLWRVFKGKSTKRVAKRIENYIKYSNYTQPGNKPNQNIFFFLQVGKMV
jgi:hypothetical protein